MSYTFTIAHAEGGIKLNTLKDGDYDFIKAYDGNLMSISAKIVIKLQISFMKQLVKVQ